MHHPPPPRRRSLQRTFDFSSLPEDQARLLHQASLEILARTGLRFFHDKALDLFRRGGAHVSDGNLVRIPSNMVEWALRCAPANIAIYDREGKRVMNVGGHRNYFGPGCDCMYVYDLQTGERRRAVVNDVVEGVRLVDALPNIDFVMSLFMPEDAPIETFEKHQMAIILKETTKPIVFVGPSLESTTNAVQMAALVAGGLDVLQRQPFILNYVNPSSVFHHNHEAVDRLLYAAELGLPSIYLPGNGRGTTAPFTLAGAMALGNAGQLAGLVLAQLQREGTPVIRNNTRGGGLDFRTMVDYYSSPNQGAYGWDLGRYYGLPMFGTAGCSDAKVFDAQAAGEAALSLFANVTGGANLIHNCGYLNGGMTFSLELLAFCDELIGWLKDYASGLEITEETLALDLIHQIGPDGSFLETEHTLRHCRTDWQPTLMDRRNYDGWTRAGATTLQARANQKVRQLIETHRAVPLAANTARALEAIVAAADARQPPHNG